jgi:cyclophilin family peptidyl-prolyl cis-trans isomerase
MPRQAYPRISVFLRLVALATLLPAGLALRAVAQEGKAADQSTKGDLKQAAAEAKADEAKAKQLDTAAPAAPPAPSPLQAAYDAELAKLTSMIDQLDALRVEYKNAMPDDRKAIREKFEAKLREYDTIEQSVRKAAEAAYNAEPNKNEDVRDFLVSMVLQDLRHDRFEDALRLSEVLIKNKYDNARIYNAAGVAAYNSNEFDKAEQFFKVAKEQNALQTDGTRLSDPAGLETSKKAWAEEQAKRAADAKADDLPRVEFETNKGKIVLELFENEAPNTTANFISLVEKGFYDGISFHRVLPGFMAQGGDPTGTGGGGPGYTIACETEAPNHRNHFRGTLSMAHAGKDTGGSQFFLTFGRTPHLDGKHTVFGRVIDGFDVLSKLQRRDPDRDEVTPDKIVHAKVLRKRPHEYKPVTTAEKK